MKRTFTGRNAIEEAKPSSDNPRRRREQPRRRDLVGRVEEYTRGLEAGHRVEKALRRAKRKEGLGHYQVRTWAGWHPHQALALVAAWLLTQENRRGKNTRRR